MAMIFSCGSVSYDIITPRARVSGFVEYEGNGATTSASDVDLVHAHRKSMMRYVKAYVGSILLRRKFSRIDGMKRRCCTS
jgi:hypothetical protein